MENVTRTIYGMYLQTVKARDSIFTLVPNTTLNEKLNNGIIEPVPNGLIPSINYLAIGDGGHVLVPNGGNGNDINTVYHKPIHAALFNQIPFISRPVSNDLSVSEMSKYRLKIETVINAVPYYFYYLRIIDESTTTSPNIVNVYTKNDITVVTDFINDISNLTPVPDNTATVAVPTHTDYISVLDSIPFNLTLTDMLEITSAYQLLTGTNNNPIISEIAICSGVDKDLTDSNLETYTEVAAAQINYFINTYYLLQDSIDSVNEINTFIELGGLEIMPVY